MKKMLLALLVLGLGTSVLRAQTATMVLVHGSVTDAIGMPVANHQLHISTDSVLLPNGNLFSYNTSVLTDSLGFYSVYITFPAGIFQGVVYVSTTGCGISLLNIGAFSSSNPVIPIHVILPCNINGGGCQSWFSYINNQTSFDFTSYTTSTNVSNYFWDFGDSSYSTVSNPSHTFAKTGIYNVCLMVVDSNNCTSGTCQYIYVCNSNNFSVTFTSAATNNPGEYSFTPTATGSSGLSYFWDFGDGHFDFVTNPTHIYTQVGAYSVSVTVVDSLGCFASYSQVVVVTQGGVFPCQAMFATTSMGNTVKFANYSKFNPQDSTVHFWDFGDGNTSYDFEPMHTYANDGVYMVCLTVSDTTGCVSTYCDSVLVNMNSGCAPYFTFTATQVAGEVVFGGYSNGLAPYTYFWDFGDGTTATGDSVAHIYNYNGYYLVCLQVFTADSCTNDYCTIVYISNATNTGNNYFDIKGFLIIDSLNSSTQSGMAYLIEYDSITGTLTAVDSMYAWYGYFTFDSLSANKSYLLKGALLPTDPQYANYMPTYFENSLYWYGAQHITGFTNPSYFYPLFLVKGSNIGSGPGFIGGLISQGANRGGAGDPMAHVLVMLFDANMNPVTFTHTDHNGNYSFDNLPLGDYFVYVEHLGVPATHFHVHLDANNHQHNAINFNVNTTQVLSATSNILAVESSRLFPNPSDGNVTLSITARKNFDATVRILNTVGQVVSEQRTLFNTGFNALPLSVNQQPAGIYLVQLISGSEIQTYKLMKK